MGGREAEVFMEVCLEELRRPVNFRFDTFTLT